MFLSITKEDAPSILTMIKGRTESDHIAVQSLALKLPQHPEIQPIVRFFRVIVVRGLIASYFGL